MARIDVMLLTSEIDHLHRLALRNDTSVSAAFGLVVEGLAETALGQGRRSHKTRLCILIRDEHLDLLDRLAARWGLTRSDAARRLVDAARLGETAGEEAATKAAAA